MFGNNDSEVNKKMDKQNKKVPEWRKEARVGVVISLAAVLLFGGMYAIARNTRHHNPTSNNSGLSDIVVVPPSIDIPPISTGGEVVNPIDDPMTEVMNKPFRVDVKIARYFYDMQDDLETRSQAIVAVPGKTNTYAKSLGVDYVSENTYDVLAACSGVVIAKSNDSIYGNMLLIEHKSGIRTLYCSLGEMTVNKGAEVHQGDKIGTSGESTYTAGLGESLHFEILKNDNSHVNPEKSYNQLVKEL